MAFQATGNLLYFFTIIYSCTSLLASTLAPDTGKFGLQDLEGDLRATFGVHSLPISEMHRDLCEHEREL